MTAQPARLTIAETTALLEATPTVLRTLFGALPRAALRRRPAPDEWCVLEVVGHLSEAEQRGFAGRIRRILDEEDHLCLTWDPPAVARARGDQARDPTELLAEFSELRRDSVALVTALSETEVVRCGRHPEVGRLAIADLLNEWVHHDQEHLRQILALIQDSVWPYMGNAQRFSRP
jgi:hypothetical protein